MIQRIRRDSSCLEEVRLAARDQAYGSAADNKALTLRGRRLSSSECPPEVLCKDIRPFGEVFTALDISYTSDCTWDTVDAFCVSLPHLQSLSAQCCDLCDPVKVLRWPQKLKNLNLARNSLRQCPPGLESLPALRVINLSGNLIEALAQDVLKLSQLKKLHLTGNPLVYPPKSVAQQGVEAVRRYYGVTPMPVVHSATSVTDGGYDSAGHCPGTSQEGSTIMDTTCSEGEEEEKEDYNSRRDEESSEEDEESSEVEEDLIQNCPGTTPLSFSPDMLPPLYSWVATEHSCQVYLPRGHDLVEVQIHVVQDHSLLPPLQPNEILATPVVSVQPHGRIFPSDFPAVLVIPHCIDPSRLSSTRLVPMCSNTTAHQSPQWKKLDSSMVEIFGNCIKLTTIHFSLFAVLLRWPYPSTAVEVDPQCGAHVTVQEVPGLSVSLPPGALQEPVCLKTVVYFGDEPYHTCSGAALASPCIGLEPHGQQFSKPVDITVPIPDCDLIREEFGSQLSLWCAEYSEERAPLHWEREDVPYELQEVEPGLCIICFSVTHFSWYKWMWDLPQALLQAARAGAVYVFQRMRVQAISVRCQVLMSPPIHDRTCGMAVAVFRFGEPLRSIANYKWILADSGERRRYLRTGTIEVVLTGNFEPISEFEENELKERVTFTGQDFCLEFALKLKDTVELPLRDHQVIGKLVLKEITEESGRAVISVNLIKVRMCMRSICVPKYKVAVCFVLLLPPFFSLPSTSAGRSGTWEFKANPGRLPWYVT